MNSLLNYTDLTIQSITKKISDDIIVENFDLILNIDLYNSHIIEQKSAKFQNYYFKTLQNKNYYLNSNSFFKEFKSQYSLQGIDNGFLNKLEQKKSEILSQIEKEELAKLYFSDFKTAYIKYGKSQITKELGSFFAKLVHTFLPNKYCALDSPIKEYFGLKNESFYVAFICISESYKTWATKNQLLIEKIKTELKALDKNEILTHENLTDLKLLDLIFWSKANRKKKSS